MRSENYVAFFTVCGFFVGLIFSIVKFDDILYIFFYTFAITLFFHMFIHLVLVLFIEANEIFEVPFDKETHEEIANEQIRLLKNKEDHITALLKSINSTNEYEKEGAKG
jgi:hypothetical protein